MASGNISCTVMMNLCQHQATREVAAANAAQGSSEFLTGSESAAARGILYTNRACILLESSSRCQHRQEEQQGQHQQHQQEQRTSSISRSSSIARIELASCRRACILLESSSRCQHRQEEQQGQHQQHQQEQRTSSISRSSSIARIELASCRNRARDVRKGAGTAPAASAGAAALLASTATPAAPSEFNEVRDRIKERRMNQGAGIESAVGGRSVESGAGEGRQKGD